MLLGEAAEGDVREGAEEVQVPNDGQSRWRRLVAAFVLLPSSCLTSHSEPIIHKQEEEREDEQKA